MRVASPWRAFSTQPTASLGKEALLTSSERSPDDPACGESRTSLQVCAASSPRFRIALASLCRGEDPPGAGAGAAGGAGGRGAPAPVRPPPFREAPLRRGVPAPPGPCPPGLHRGVRLQSADRPAFASAF